MRSRCLYICQGWIIFLFATVRRPIDPPFSTWMGFLSVIRAMISKACFTMRRAIIFFPLFLPCIIREFTKRSTRGHWALRKRFFWYLSNSKSTRPGDKYQILRETGLLVAERQSRCLFYCLKSRHCRPISSPLRPHVYAHQHLRQ